MNHIAIHHIRPQGWARGATALVAAGVLLLSACASTPPPTAQLAVGKASVDRANGSAAEAPMELAAARDKIARANVAMAGKDYDLARQLAEQADADATLAEAQARSARTSKSLAEVREGLRVLREEMSRK